MSNARFMYFNLIDQAETELSLVSGGENVFYPLSNLKQPQASTVYRSATGETEAVILIDCQVASVVSGFMAVGNSVGTLNIESIAIEGNATLDFSTPAFATTVADFDYDNNVATLFFTPQTYRYWRVTIEGGSSYVELANMFLGKYETLVNNNVGLGMTIENEDTSIVSRGRYGQRYFDRITSQKTIGGKFSLLNRDEFDVINEMYEYCGLTRPVWVVLDPGELILNNKDFISGYFYFTKRPGFTNDYYGLYSSTFTLSEVK